MAYLCVGECLELLRENKRAVLAYAEGLSIAESSLGLEHPLYAEALAAITKA